MKIYKVGALEVYKTEIRESGSRLMVVLVGRKTRI